VEEQLANVGIELRSRDARVLEYQRGRQRHHWESVTERSIHHVSHRTLFETERSNEGLPERATQHICLEVARLCQHQERHRVGCTKGAEVCMSYQYNIHGHSLTAKVKRQAHLLPKVMSSGQRTVPHRLQERGCVRCDRG
jgi:hypothetical protein